MKLSGLFALGFLIIIFLSFQVANLQAQNLNRKMRVDTLRESAKINPEADKSHLTVHSQIPGLRFDSNRNIEVRQISSGDWELWLPYGTHILKLYAEGFQGLELQPFNFARKRCYEMTVSAIGFAPASRADENLVEVVFQCNEDNVYSSYGDYTPTLSISNIIAYKLPPGDYTFNFMKKGFKTLTKTLKIQSSQNVLINLEKGESRFANSLSLPGIVLITSEPVNCEILINGQKIGNTPYQGEITPGTHQLELRKNMFYPEISSFSIEKGKTQSLNISLKPRFGFLSVTSSHPQSRITLDGKLVTGNSIDKMEIESNIHQLKIEADLYHSFTQEFSVSDGESKTIIAELKPAFGSLEINSLPVPGAEVFIDGQKAGITPFSRSKMPSGKYTIKVTKEFYNEVEEQIIITDNSKLTKNVVLSTNFGELSVDAPGCSIFLNGKLSGKDNYHAKLGPGNYKLKAEKGEHYYDAEEDVFLRVGENRTLKLEPRPRLGSLSVFVEPIEARDAELYIDDELKGNAPLVFSLLAGLHTVKAKKDNFIDAVENIKINENVKNTLTLSLSTFEGSRQQKLATWQTVKWISFGSAALAGAASAYFYYSANKNFDSYKTATSSNNAGDFRNTTERHDNISRIALYTATAALSSAVISWIIELSL